MTDDPVAGLIEEVAALGDGLLALRRLVSTHPARDDLVAAVLVLQQQQETIMASVAYIYDRRHG